MRHASYGKCGESATCILDFGENQTSLCWIIKKIEPFQCFSKMTQRALRHTRHMSCVTRHMVSMWFCNELPTIWWKLDFSMSYSNGDTRVLVHKYVFLEAPLFQKGGGAIFGKPPKVECGSWWILIEDPIKHVCANFHAFAQFCTLHLEIYNWLPH